MQGISWREPVPELHIIIVSLSTTWLGQETAKRAFDLRVNQPPALLSTHQGKYSKADTDPFECQAEKL